MKKPRIPRLRLTRAAVDVAVESLETRRLFCFLHTGDDEMVAPLTATDAIDTNHPEPIAALGASYTTEDAYALSEGDRLAAEDFAPSPSAVEAVRSGFVPLASTPTLQWATGYFAQTSTLDLQAGVANAPDVAVGEAASLPRAVPINANGLPLLESRANGEGLELFLDFARNADGRGTFSLDADRDNFNFAEQSAIYTCWRGIVGFFSQFNVNVTTVLPPTGSTDPNFAWIQVSNEFAGGAAYVGWLAKDGPKGWVNSSNATDRISGVAHEFGHILSLTHQAEYDKYGTKTEEYTDGLDYRNRPIMGVDFLGTLRKFSYGRQSDSSSIIQDDPAQTASYIAGTVGGDGYRTDDFGGTLGSAYTLAPGSQQLDGYTERYGDSDVFKITPTTAGPWNFTATPLHFSQAEPKLELLDSSGNIIAARDDADYRFGPTNEQLLTLNLNPGTYYVRVSSGGDHDELGYYKFAATQLPAYMDSVDVGTPGINGSVTYDATTGVFTQSGGGTDIWNQSDQIRFTYAVLNGNGSITARVDALDNIGYYTKSGVMIRQSLAADSAHAYLGVLPNGNLDPIYRTTAGGTAQNSPFSAGSGPWVRITRAGNLFTYESSSNGTSWTTLGSQTISMAGTAYIGLATSAWSDRYEAFATFSNVSISGNITPTAPTYNALSAPATLTASPAAGASTSVNLNWSAVAGATGYKIERSVDGINFSQLTTVGTVTSYTDPNLWGSMRWFYRVSAANGTSLYSAPSPIANTINKPNAPTGMPGGYTPTVLGIGTTELYLNWTDVQGETGYRIERSLDGVNFGNAFTTGANETAANITGLATATAYTFRITPLTSVGDGVATPLIIGTQTRMAAVTNLRFTAKSSTSMSIAWNDAPLETAFRVERSLDGAAWTTLGNASANVLTWTDNTVTAGNEYYYRVTPWNSSFDGLTSGVIFAGAPAASLPAGWTNADIGTVAGTGAAVNTGGSSWKVVSGGGDVYNTADSFNFTYRAVTADTTIVAKIDTLEVTDNAAKAGLMFRQDLTPVSKSVAVMLNAGGGYGVDLRTRTTANGGTGFQQLLANVAAPYWLKLQRVGNQITASVSADGVTFTNATAVNLPLTGTFYVGLAVNSSSNTILNTSTFGNVAVTAVGGVPTVATAASATPNPVTGTTTNLSVLGADDGGEANLTYAWSVTAKPAGAADPTFSVNSTNAAKNSVATFSAAGNYTFTVTISDVNGQAVTSSANVTVQSVLAGVRVTPAASSLAVSTTRQLAAAAIDQFGVALASQPASFTWSLTGGGNVSASGLYTAPASMASAVVRASTGAASGTASLNVVAVGGEVAWYKFNEPSGATAFDNSGHGRDATLSASGATFGAGTAGGALALTGGGLATLPAGVVGSITGNFTIATWVKLTTVDQWSRVFDFGNNATAYMYFTPAAAGTGKPRFGITTSGGGAAAGEQFVDSSTAIAANSWTHVVVRLLGNSATIFLNGVAVGTNPNVTLRPSNLGATSQNWIGKSQYPDPALNGSVDDFRIYDRALNSTEIGALSQQPRFAYVFNNRLYVDMSGTPITLSTNASGNVLATQGATTLTFLPATFTDILVTGTPTTDALTIGATLPRPITFVSGGSTGAKDALKVSAGATHTFAADLGVTVPSAALEVNGSTTFTATQHLASLKVTGVASIAAGGGVRVLDVAAIDLTGGGTIDVGDHAMIVRSGQIGTSNGGTYNGIQGLVQQGSNGGAWDGAGIRTSMSEATAGLTSLGVGTGEQVKGIGANETSVFAGQTIDGNAIIVMYTYAGDANMDGQITGDDYSAIDFNILTGTGDGWYNGDFNYDGVITGDDYSAIDFNILAQGAPFPIAGAAKPISGNPPEAVETSLVDEVVA